MSDQPRYQTLRDYLTVVRAQRWIILLCVALFAGAAFAYSSGQEERYEAESALAFKDVTEDLRFLGVVPAIIQNPVQRAAISAQRVNRPDVAERVRDELELKTSVKAVQGAVSARPEAQTSLVVINAQAGSGELAAQLANEFARQVREVVAEEDDKLLAEAERSIEKSRDDALDEARDKGGNENFIRTSFADRLTRIRALRDFGSTVQISRRAEVSDSPFAPNPVRNTGLGLLIGLALGLLVAFVRDSLDVRLRGAREIQAQVKLPVVGHIGSGALGAVANTAANGHRRLSPADLESFRIMRKNLDFLDIDRPLRTLAVTSALPEEGKSTVAAALAFTFALGGKRTLLVECDLRRPSLGARLGINKQPGLTDYLSEHSSPQEVLQGVPLVDAAANGKKNGRSKNVGQEAVEQELVCITAGSPAPRPADILASKRFREFLVQVQEAYDIVILDTSPILPVSDTLELLPQVDAAILCIRAGQTKRDEARAARAALEHLPDRPKGLVVTGIKPGDEADYGYYSAAHSYGVPAQS